MFDFLRDIVGRVPDYSHGHSDAGGDDRAYAKRRLERWFLFLFLVDHNFPNGLTGLYPVQEKKDIGKFSDSYS